MAQLHRNVQKYVPAEKLGKKTFGKKTYDQIHFLGTKAVKMDEQAKAAENAVREAKNEKVIPLADEEEIERQQRRSNARRRGGRASTVLTDEDRLGGY